MNEHDLKQSIIRLAEPVVHSLGLCIWGVEIAQAGRMVVRLYVDVPAAPAAQAHSHMAPEAEPCTAQPAAEGLSEALAEVQEDGLDAETHAQLSASLDQCEEISRHLGLALEVEDLIPTAYVLEVSTPGLTRPFFQLEQMRAYVGDVVEARLLVPVAAEGSTGGPRRKWCGTLSSVDADSFTLNPVLVSPEGVVSPDTEPPVHLPWSSVRRASRLYIFRQPVKPGKGPHGADTKAGAAAAPRKSRKKRS